jgi:hypothetical protein
MLKALELVLAERFLSTTRFRSARNLFYTEVYDSLLQNDKQLVKTVKELQMINEGGILTRVFLRECQILGTA